MFVLFCFYPLSYMYIWGVCFVYVPFIFNIIPHPDILLLCLSVLVWCSWSPRGGRPLARASPLPSSSGPYPRFLSPSLLPFCLSLLDLNNLSDGVAVDQVGVAVAHLPSSSFRWAPWTMFGHRFRGGGPQLSVRRRGQDLRTLNNKCLGSLPLGCPGGETMQRI